MSKKLQATIKSKDGIRVFNLSIGSMSQQTQKTLELFFGKKDPVTLETLLSFCVTQTEKFSQSFEKNSSLQEENKNLKEQNQTLLIESQKLQDQLEEICKKIEEI